MKFIEKLQDDLRPSIDKILNHDFINRIADAWLNKEQLQYFAREYYVYCFHFPRFLSACAANIPDDETRMPIIDNLWEEHGEGDLSKSHRILYRNFAIATGVKKSELNFSNALPSTRICIENLLNLCIHSHFIESLGALGPGTEYFTNDEYIKIERGLKKYDFLSPEDYKFWTVHIGLDEIHYSEMVAPLSKWLGNTENQERLRRGAQRAIELEILFWDGLEEHLPGK